MRKVRRNGFTLMELMIVVTITAVLIVSGMGLFYRALRGGSKAESLKLLDQNSELVMNLLQSHIRNARSISGVGSGTCPGTGSSLSVVAFDGLTTVFNLTADGKVASNSSEISEDTITISNLNFVCDRQAGIPDKITVSFTAQRIIDGTVIDERDYTSVVGLRNF